MDEPVQKEPRLDGGRLLAGNALIEIAGAALPALVGVLAIPRIIEGLGADRFGVLALAWTLIGYFNLLELGMGRALTKLLSEKLAAARERDIPPLFWTSLALGFVLASAGALILALASPWLVERGLRIPVELRAETRLTLYILAPSVPIVIAISALRGTLEACQRFDLVNAIRIPMGVFTFISPLLVFPFAKTLPAVVGALAIARVISCLFHLLLCRRVLPVLRGRPVVQRAAVTPLLRFGSWVTVSSMVGRLVAHLDRFLVGGMISTAAVAYYATPSEVVSRIRIIPFSLARVLFPAFSASYATDRQRAMMLSVRGVKYVFLSMFPIALLIVTLASEALELWLGPEFARQSFRVLQLLTAGALMNSLSQVLLALIQGSGRPDLAAKLHLVELPLYLTGLWWMTGRFGIVGAALAWAARAALDAIALCAITLRLLPLPASVAVRTGVTVGAALLLLGAGALLTDAAGKGLFLLATLLAFLLVSWFLILEADERSMLRSRFEIPRR